MSTVTWVLNGSSYEVSSKEHLLQIMQLGTFTGDDLITYSPGGSVPPSYITSDFIQTVDIDLEQDSNCFPVGRLTGTAFTGIYDGGSFSISNFTSPAASSAVHGLFGWIGGATLKDIKLSGNWITTGSSNTADVSGVLIARLNGTGNIIERIDINGVVTCTGTTDSFGCIVSKIQGSVDITDITVRGIVNGTAVDYTGGIIGHIDSGTVVAKNIRYAPTGDLEYTRAGGSGLNGTNAVGSIVGTIDAVSIVTIENAVNGMVGNLTGVNCGGVIGMSLITNAANMICTNLVNGMTGSLLASGAGGGIFGRSTVGTSSYLLNVMKGGITTSSRAGGIAGLFVNGTATNAIIAMNGDISGSALANSDVGAATIQAGTLTIEWATSDFGLTVFGSGIVDVLTKPVAASPWAYHTDFPEIPYLEMNADDSELNTSYVSTPFPNISGNGTIYDLEYDYYTVGFDSTFFPVETVLGTPVGVYSLFKYDTTGFNVIESQGLGISFVGTPYSSLYLRLFSYIAVLQWYGTATSYSVSSTATGFSEVFQFDNITSLTAQLTVDPNVEYIFKVYGDDVPIGTTTAKTSPVASGASITDIVTYLGNDLTSLDDTSVAGVVEYIGDALNTLDEVSAIVHNGLAQSSKTLTFVDYADTINITNLSNLLTPFVPTGGATQSVILELSDTSTETVTYDESLDEITVDSITYSVGDTFILDGKKVRVASLED